MSPTTATAAPLSPPIKLLVDEHIDQLQIYQDYYEHKKRCLVKVRHRFESEHNVSAARDAKVCIRNTRRHLNVLRFLEYKFQEEIEDLRICGCTEIRKTIADHHRRLINVHTEHEKKFRREETDAVRDLVKKVVEEE